MANNAKEQTALLKLKEQLKLLLPTYTIAENSDASGAELLISQSATPAAGEVNVAIRLKKHATDFKDVLGLSQPVYAPLVMQSVHEAGLVAAFNKQQIDAALNKVGMKHEVYTCPNLTAPALSMFVSDGTVTGTLAGIIEADIMWPLSGQ